MTLRKSTLYVGYLASAWLFKDHKIELCGCLFSLFFSSAEPPVQNANSPFTTPCCSPALTALGSADLPLVKLNFGEGSRLALEGLHIGACTHCHPSLVTSSSPICLPADFYFSLIVSDKVLSYTDCTGKERDMTFTESLM